MSATEIDAQPDARRGHGRQSRWTRFLEQPGAEAEGDAPAGQSEDDPRLRADPAAAEGEAQEQDRARDQGPSHRPRRAHDRSGAPRGRATSARLKTTRRAVDGTEVGWPAGPGRRPGARARLGPRRRPARRCRSPGRRSGSRARRRPTGDGGTGRGGSRSRRSGSCGGEVGAFGQMGVETSLEMVQPEPELLERSCSDGPVRLPDRRASSSLDSVIDDHLVDGDRRPSHQVTLMTRMARRLPHWATGRPVRPRVSP